MIKKDFYHSPFGYPNAHAFVKGMEMQAAGKYEDIPSYFRSGFPHLALLERKVAGLLGIHPENNEFALLTTSGMSAVTLLLEMASLKKGDVVIHGTVEYGKIEKYMSEYLPAQDIDVTEVHVQDRDEIDQILKKRQKKGTYGKIVLFLETVGNGPAMPVVDIEKLLSLTSIKQLCPTIIIDNTLPTDAVMPLVKIMRQHSDLSIFGVQSATKFYLQNEDLGGIIYTINGKYKQELIAGRTVYGVTPGPSLVDAFRSYLPKSKETFRQFVKVSMQNTFLLAKVCAKAPGEGKRFFVSYPNLKTHPQYQYVEKNYPWGIAPVFFLTPGRSAKMTAEELFYRLEKLGAFHNCLITESFGFELTNVSYGTRFGGYIRIAGGMESIKQVTLLGKQLHNALASI